MFVIKNICLSLSLSPTLIQLATFSLFQSFGNNTARINHERRYTTKIQLNLCRSMTRFWQSVQEILIRPDIMRITTFRRIISFPALPIPAHLGFSGQGIVLFVLAGTSDMLIFVELDKSTK